MSMRSAAVVAGLALGLMSGTAKAAYIIDVYQDGMNVIASGSGSINTDALIKVRDTGNRSGTQPSIGYLLVGPDGFDDLYIGLSGPANFGNGGAQFSDITSGKAFGVVGGPPAGISFLITPDGYISGAFSGVSTSEWTNATIDSLGFRKGSYRYTWGSGVDADSFTVNVLSSVPLPASAPMFGAALLGLAGLGYVAKRKKVAAAA